MTLSVIVEADGGSRGNPGPAGYGAVVFDALTHQVLAERGEYIGVETNNVAEYRGLIAGLSAAAELGATSVTVRMDSKLVIEQMAGRWQVKHPSMRPLAREASALRGRFEQISWLWIPREQNKHADRLANEAMDAGTGRPVTRRAAAGPAVPNGDAAPVGPRVPSPVALPLWESVASPTRMLLVRHGSTEHSPERRYSGRNELPLSRLGRDQADALADRAAATADIAAVLTSPLPRARQTAEAVATRLHLPVQEVPGLTEADFGEWEGLVGAEVRERWPREYAAWLGSAAGAPPGGESFDAVTTRVRRARDEMIRSFAGQIIVVVTHVTPIKTLLRLALEAPIVAMFRMQLDTASVSIIDYLEDGTASVRLVNDTSHLGSVSPPEG